MFKGERLSRTVVKNNILRIWGMTSDEERNDWYLEALEYAQILAEKIRGANSVNKACGVIAALSPVKTWRDNKNIALDMIMYGDCGHMNQFKDKARRIMSSSGEDDVILDILNGNKISAFYINIRYPHKAEVTTIDRHALSIALGRWVTDEEYRGMTTNQYEFFMHCYAIAGAKVGVSPVLMQSATWTKWRKIKKDYR
jgi:hypothetical protein